MWQHRSSSAEKIDDGNEFTCPRLPGELAGLNAHWRTLLITQRVRQLRIFMFIFYLIQRKTHFLPGSKQSDRGRSVKRNRGLAKKYTKRYAHSMVDGPLITGGSGNAVRQGRRINSSPAH